MNHGSAHRYYSHGLKIGETVHLHNLVCNKYGISNTFYLVITINQIYEQFPCGIISNHGEVFFFSGYETI